MQNFTKRRRSLGVYRHQELKYAEQARKWDYKKKKKKRREKVLQKVEVNEDTNLVSARDIAKERVSMST